MEKGSNRITNNQHLEERIKFLILSTSFGAQSKLGPQTNDAHEDTPKPNVAFMQTIIRLNKFINRGISCMDRYKENKLTRAQAQVQMISQS